MIALFFLFCLAFAAWCFWYFGSPSQPSSTSPRVSVGSPDGENAPIQELKYFCVKDKGWCYRYWNQGVKVKLVPDCLIVHILNVVFKHKSNILFIIKFSISFFL